MGLSADSRCIIESRAHSGPHHNCQHPEVPWHRPSTGAKSENDMEEFLTRHWDQIVATDFFTVEVWTCSGLTRFIVLFLYGFVDTRVQIGGIASSANGLWMAQIARNLTDAVDGFFVGKRYLIHDRDPLYTGNF